MNRTSWARYHQVKQVARARFPLAFPPSGAPTVPLAIGIYHELCEALADAVPREHIRPFIRGWTSRREYLIAVATGGHRVGLDGTPSGEVEEGHRLWAAVRLHPAAIPSGVAPAPNRAPPWRASTASDRLVA